MKAVTRPRSLRASAAPILMRAVTIEPEFRRVSFRDNGKDAEVTLRPTAFEVLRMLSMSPGAMLTLEEILRSLWGVATPIRARNVDLQIAFIRTALRGIGQGCISRLYLEKDIK
ncbi:winged helix-turn-helix domain-containing protein [Paraburkholderia strydomiana]|uniref:winged helix-turn-helix domain-containing protein n=1 Tax=Paraburkholderia strydomiana TaxID=1245417 RepID=UPI001BE62A1B|nr:winged helix-turn-helix domain-containing protein [Paraburkholderia strydomiana]MBT2790092.1 winged helix-turn-helix domain-containing protein [Paraburkholderia strydomiana]